MVKYNGSAIFLTIHKPFELLFYLFFKVLANYNISIIWIKGHNNLPGNELADKIAKIASRAPNSNTLSDFQLCNLRMFKNRTRSKSLSYNFYKNSAHNKSLLPIMNKDYSIDLPKGIVMDKYFLFFLTNIGPSNYHLFKLGKVLNQNCRLCDLYPETMKHFLSTVINLTI